MLQETSHSTALLNPFAAPASTAAPASIPHTDPRVISVNRAGPLAPSHASMLAMSDLRPHSSSTRREFNRMPAGSFRNVREGSSKTRSKRPPHSKEKKKRKDEGLLELYKIETEDEMHLAISTWTKVVASYPAGTTISMLLQEATGAYHAAALLAKMPGQQPTQVRGRVSCHDYADFLQSLRHNSTRSHLPLPDSSTVIELDEEQAEPSKPKQSKRHRADIRAKDHLPPLHLGQISSDPTYPKSELRKAYDKVLRFAPEIPSTAPKPPLVSSKTGSKIKDENERLRCWFVDNGVQVLKPPPKSQLAAQGLL